METSEPRTSPETPTSARAPGPPQATNAVGAADPAADPRGGPRPPETLAETGLSAEAVTELLFKILYVQGSRVGSDLSDVIRLPFHLIDDLLLRTQERQLVQVLRTTGVGRGGYIFDLTDGGRRRARDAMEVPQYVGPAPVPLHVLTTWIRRQSLQRAGRVDRALIRRAFSDLIFPPEILEALGPALNSGRSLFLYGDSGNGKTSIAERVPRLRDDSIFVPHAVDIDGHTMVFFDPVHHEPVDEVAAETSEFPWLKDGHDYDRRFVRIRRPSLMVGGELTMDELDLRYDPHSKMYQAPFQLKASGGVFIIDDFGRQRVDSRNLLNRWIVPLEKRVDFLSLHTGKKFPVPFESLLVFATNLDPEDLVEEAFLRRIQYKIHIGSPGRKEYERIFRDVVDPRGIAFDPAGIDFIYRTYYEGMGLPPRAVHPRDIVDHVENLAAYRGVAPALTEELLEPACRSYFLVTSGGGSDGAA